VGVLPRSLRCRRARRLTVGAALALLVAGCGGGGGSTGGTNTNGASAARPAPYLDMHYLGEVFQAHLEREDPEAFIVEVICGRTGPAQARCNVREDEQTKGYPIRITEDGRGYALKR
jgi:hypothetical protein